MRKPLLVCLTLAVLVTIAFAQKKADVDAVKAADAAFEKAFAAKDLDSAVKFYADDAVTMEPGMPAIAGKQAIKASMKQFMDDKNFDLHWTAEAAEVAKSGDLAYTRGSFDAKFTDPSGKPASDHGKYVTIWKKIGGEWKVVVDTNNSDGPAK